MEINVISQESPYTFQIVGRLDTNTAPTLEDFIQTVYDKNINDILVDCEECHFVSSAGLRVIVAMQKHASGTQGNLAFKNVAPEIMEVFEMTGFNNILTFV